MSQQLANFVWGIADQIRGVYKPAQYGQVILPFTVLRRMECVMNGHRPALIDLAAKVPNEAALAAKLRRDYGLHFWNTSSWTLKTLLGDPESLADNLIDYVSAFSANVADIFAEFGFEKTIRKLDENDRLYLVVDAFADDEKVDLHPKALSNAGMGQLFEHLIYKFSTASNETAGEHFTPRDAIRLMVDLLFAGDDQALSEKHAVRSVYDPTAGTGGMLSLAEEHLIGTPEHPGLNPDARLQLYGQEINDQSYAICKSDMIVRNQDASNIRLGDTLADDLFAGRTFDYCLSNPPYGVDWKASERAVKDEVARAGTRSRFPGGLPAISDGQMLFLQHLATKMRPVHEGGGRAGIVLNGSPLFTGAAQSGPSQIRRWLLENDLVDAIVALPTNMFYNTGIATYVWILDNDKPAERIGKVQLIDGSGFFTKMRKNLGAKSRELSAADREWIVKLYAAYDGNDEQCRIFPTDAFGYWTITVERPLLDENGEVVRDRWGRPKPDAKLRDTENIPFTYGGNDLGADGATAAIKAYVEAEVLPHVPDAWVDDKKTKVGYEIPFARHFYKYVPPRPLEEIDADLNQLVSEILELLREVES